MNERTKVELAEIMGNKPYEADDRCPECNYRWLTTVSIPASDELPAFLKVECDRCGIVHWTRHADAIDHV